MENVAETFECVELEEESGFPTLPVLDEQADAEAAQAVLANYEAILPTLPPPNKYTLKAWAEAIDCVKASKNTMEAKRKGLVSPLNKEVDDINAAYMPLVKGFDALARRMAEIPNRFIEEQRRLALEEQRRLNAEAEQKRIAEQRKAEEARKAAEAAAAAGNEKEAAKLTSKAEAAEFRAENAVAPIVETVARKVEVGEGAVSFGGGKKKWNLPGWAGDKPIDLLDPLLAPLVGDLTKLPPGIQFLLRFSQLDPRKLNKAYALKEKFPHPFGETTDYSGTRKS